MKVLSKIEYENIKTIFTNDCNLEFELNSLVCNEVDITLLKESILNIIITTKLYNLFTEAGISLIVSFVFENIILRDFILGLTDRFFCNVTYLQDEDIKHSIEYSIARGISSNYSIENEYNVTPNKIVDNISLDFNLVYNILKQNKWLVTIVLIVIFVEHTELSNSKT